MSTRSGIAIKNNDNTYTWIYCHYDGYPANVGQKLLDHYTTRAQIEQLMQLGDISWLGDVPVDPGDLWQKKEGMYTKRENESADEYEQRIDQMWDEMNHWTLSYQSSDAKDVQAVSGLTYQQLVSMFRRSDREYLYVWDERHGWRVKEGCERIKSLALVLEKVA